MVLLFILLLLLAIWAAFSFGGVQSAKPGPATRGRRRDRHGRDALIVDPRQPDSSDWTADGHLHGDFGTNGDDQFEGGGGDFGGGGASGSWGDSSDGDSGGGSWD